MVTRAVLRYVRISPRKVRPVIPLVKGKRPEEAIAILFSVKKKASQYLIDLLRSAMANAKRIQGMDMSTLYVSNIIANGGPQMKRFRAASMGRAGEIRKRTSHITVELDQLAPKAKEHAARAAEPKHHDHPARSKKSAVVKRGEQSAEVTKPRAKEAAKTAPAKKGKE